MIEFIFGVAMGFCVGLWVGLTVFQQRLRIIMKEKEQLVQIGNIDDLEEAYGDTYSKERTMSDERDCWNCKHIEKTFNEVPCCDCTSLERDKWEREQ